MPYERYTGNTQSSVLPRTVKRCLTFNKKNHYFVQYLYVTLDGRYISCPEWIFGLIYKWSPICVLFPNFYPLDDMQSKMARGVSWESYHACFGATLTLLYSLDALCLYIKIKSPYLICNPPSHQCLAHTVPVFFQRGYCSVKKHGSPPLWMKN